jgi:serine/threonine protein kinase
MRNDVADTPEDGVRQVRASSSIGGRGPSIDMPDDDASTYVTPPPRDVARAGQPLLKRRITRPSFMIDLKQGSPVGEYEIQAQIGEGAMGTVYSAIHPLIGKKVAIKVLKAELCANQATIDRFVQEAKAANQIGHPNIVDVFLLGELPDGRAYMVMEWLRGQDLKTRLARGPMTVTDACDILDSIARALEAAHAKQIVHRDLKPDNVFLHRIEDGPLMVKLLDFGIAKLVRVTPGTEKTQTGNMLGTPRYISPEQARGIQVDHRSDIYSLGVMAYEMLAGRPPFQGETAMDLVVMHLSEVPPPLGQFARVPKSLEQCVMAMLEKDPNLRPSLEEIRGILVDPTRRLTPLPSRAQVIASMPIAKPRSKWPIYLVASIAAAGLGVLTWKLVSDRTQSAKPTAQLAAPAGETTMIEPASIKAAVAAPVPAPAPAPAPLERGTLEVSVSGAKDSAILVDGAEWGRGASLKVELDPGEHVVIVKPRGKPSIEQKVEINPGAMSSIAIVVPAQTTRVIRVPTKRDSSKRGSGGGDDELLTPKRNR